MLTGFTWCIPLKTKTTDEVVTAYKIHIACPFGGSVKILTDNGTKFKNKLFKEVVAKLRMEMSIHSPPYRPQSNGKIEGFHRFFKACIAKHIKHGLEWDKLTPMATACYNYFPNCSARESTFFLMFGREIVESRYLARNMQNLSISRIQGPVACTLRMKEIFSTEFHVIPSIALNQTFIHCRNTEDMNFEHFQLKNLVSSTPGHESNLKV